MVVPPAEDVGRITPRRVVSGVPPQDGDVANRCPLAVQFRTYPPPTAGSPVPPRSDIDRLREAQRIAHRGATLQRLAALHPGAVVVPSTDRPTFRGDGVVEHPAVLGAEESGTLADAVAATLAAMRAGADLILDAVLASDQNGRRLGRPVVLVRADQRPDARWAYHPVEIRHHRTLEVARANAEQATGALTASFDAPALAGAAVDETRRARTHRGDLLWLAHDHRLLEAAGHAGAPPAGGVIGPENVVVWHRLDQPVIQHRWDLPTASTESMLERYDREFSFRLDALAAASEATPIVGPVSVGECARCRWNEHCRPLIEADDSTSLLPGFGYRQWFNLARAGITTRAQVARLDLRTAVLRDELPGSLDLSDLVDAARDAAPTSAEDVVRFVLGPPVPRTDRGSAPPDGAGEREDTDRLVGQALEVCDRLGVPTAAALAALDPTVVGLAGQPIARLADAIQHARAQASGRPQLRHGLDVLRVPGADVEIDIDMESSLDGTAYLWGALAEGCYHASVRWEPPGPIVAAQVFCDFWDWLDDRRRQARAEGRTVALYCWFRGAEASALRAGARAAAERSGRPEAPEEVEALLASPEFVDLYEVFTSQLVTGGSAGLKTIAATAGFSWRDADPNGADSMAWHAAAVGSPAPPEPGSGASISQGEARQRLLSYNEDDVRATAAVRRWMRETLARGLPITRRVGPPPTPGALRRGSVET